MTLEPPIPWKARGNEAYRSAMKRNGAPLCTCLTLVIRPTARANPHAHLTRSTQQKGAYLESTFVFSEISAFLPRRSSLAFPPFAFLYLSLFLPFPHPLLSPSSPISISASLLSLISHLPSPLSLQLPISLIPCVSSTCKFFLLSSLHHYLPLQLSRFAF